MGYKYNRYNPKMKVFGESSLRKSDVFDYDKNAFGIFVLNNFDLDLAGNSHGWFAGIGKEGSMN